jgi:hypothetical protein
VTDEEKSRHEMWQNFLWHLDLGTVLQGRDDSVWQKVSKFAYRTIGASSDYSAESIPWPISILKAGVE